MARPACACSCEDLSNDPVANRAADDEIDLAGSHFEHGSVLPNREPACQRCNVLLGVCLDSERTAQFNDKAAGSDVAGELDEVVDGAQEGPFCLNLVEAAQQELSEPSGLLDLSEHRLDDLLAQSVTAASSCPL